MPECPISKANPNNPSAFTNPPNHANPHLLHATRTTSISRHHCNQTKKPTPATSLLSHIVSLYRTHCTNFAASAAKLPLVNGHILQQSSSRPALRPRPHWWAQWHAKHLQHACRSIRVLHENTTEARSGATGAGEEEEGGQR